MQPSCRVYETSQSAISSIAHLAAPDVASMAQGCVHWKPPPEALAKAASMISSPEMHSYGAVLGRDVLQSLIKEKLKTRNGIEGKEVMITPGANEAWTSVLMTITDPGDEAIIFEPYYFNAKMALELLNVRPVIAKCSEVDFTPDLNALPFSPKTRVVVLVNPSNPTGYVWPIEMIKQLQQLCAQRNVWLVSDEAYEEFLWEGVKHYSPLGDNVINIYTLSKSFGMHGWRIGYCAFPPTLRSSLLKIQDTVVINACQFSQALATECLRSHSDWPSKQFSSLDANRQVVWQVVRSYPGTIKTLGAFYFFVKLPVAAEHHSDVAVCEYLARKHKVLVTPGESFGRKGYIRVSYGNAPLEVCKESSERLARGLEAISKGEMDVKS